MTLAPKQNNPHTSLLQNFEALGTSWWIEVFDEIERETAAMVEDHCRRLLVSFNDHYSRFSPDSLVSKLNNTGSITVTDTDADTWQEYTSLLTYGKTIYTESDTVCNFLLGNILEEKGYGHTLEKSNTTIANPVSDLMITANTITLYEGAVDLGSFGKGYIIDKLARTLKETFDLKHFLINGGGDMYVTSNHEKPISIYLEHPTKPKQYFGTVALKDEAFAASSTHKRTWKKDDAETHHLIGAPETAASFVITDTATTADTFATIASILINEPKRYQNCTKHHFIGTGFSNSTQITMDATFKAHFTPFSPNQNTLTKNS